MRDIKKKNTLSLFIMEEDSDHKVPCLQNDRRKKDKIKYDFFKEKYIFVRERQIKK